MDWRMWRKTMRKTAAKVKKSLKSSRNSQSKQQVHSRGKWSNRSHRRKKLKRTKNH